MAAIAPLSLDMEGADGVYVFNPATSTNNPGSVGVTAIAGGGTAAYSGAHAKQGSTSLMLVGASGASLILSSTFTGVATFWNVYYLWVNAAPGAVTTIAQWFGDGGVNQGGSLRLNTDMTLQMRDGFTNAGAPIGPIPTGQWVRVAVKAVPGSSTGHRCKVYTASAGDSSTAAFDTGDLTATNGTNTNIDTWKFGLLTNGVNTIYIDRNRADNATEPAGLTTGLPPTVNAGPDLTKETGSGTFTITATATPSSGATIASRSWAILSGNTVALTGTTTDTVTVTAPTSTTGSTVLRYTATDNTGQSTTDDVTLTWVAPGQTLYPAADVSNAGAWTTQSGGSSSLFATVDEPVLDTSDYIASPQLTASPAGVRFRLGAKPAPTNTTGWYLRLNVRVTPDVAASSLVAKLYESDGTTLRKTWTAITGATTSDTEFQLTLTAGEVAAITSWTSGLIIELSATGS